MSNEKDRLDKLESVVYGIKPDRTDGVPHILSMHSQTLYGTDRDPGGLEKAVKTLTRALWVCTGLFGAIEVFLRVIPLILQLKG